VHYVFLGLAIVAEVAGTSLLKATDGFSRLWPTLACLGAYAVSFALVSQAVKEIPTGVAYAIWSGTGTAAIAAIGAVFLGQPLSLVKVIGIGLIIAGVVLLNLGGGAH
jgi:small multidrug resistance pump